MHSVAAVALFALVTAVGAPAAFAEDGAKLDASRQAGSEIQPAEASVAVEAESTLASPSACRGTAQAAPAAEACQSARHNRQGLIRQVDWSAVGPSADDFATTDETLRLKGARLVATYRF